MALKQRQWFFQTTSSKDRFVKDDCPSETTMQNLLDSMIFKSQLDDKAKVNDDGVEFFNLVGHVVLANDADVLSRVVQPSDKSLVVQPHQIPEVRGTGVVRTQEDGRDIFTVYNSGSGGIPPLQAVLDEGNSAEQSITVATDLGTLDNGLIQLNSSNVYLSHQVSGAGHFLGISAPEAVLGYVNASITNRVTVSPNDVRLLSYIDGSTQSSLVLANATSSLFCTGLINFYTTAPNLLKLNAPALLTEIGFFSTVGTKTTYELDSTKYEFINTATSGSSMTMDGTGLTLTSYTLANGTILNMGPLDVELTLPATGQLRISSLPQDASPTKLLTWEDTQGIVQYQDGIVVPLPPVNDGNTYKLIKDNSGVQWVLDV